MALLRQCLHELRIRQGDPIPFLPEYCTQTWVWDQGESGPGICSIHGPVISHSVTKQIFEHSPLRTQHSPAIFSHSAHEH
jgi:hypothetical protein